MGNMLAFLGRDMAVDLGTANTLAYVRGRGIALNEPSVVALNTDTGKIVTVGVQARRMIGRTAKGPPVVWTADCLLLRRAALTNEATPAHAQELRDRTSPKEIGLARKKIA